MMKTKKESALTIDKHDRRRGRPAGRNRTPLSLEERRARNAQYERERRNETADAMASLAEAAHCDPQIPNGELLATVISQLQRRAKRKLPQDIDDLRRVNQNLEVQIAALQSRLGQDADASESSEDLQSDSEEHSKTIRSDNLTDETEIQKESKSQPKLPKKSEPDSQTRKGKTMRSHKIRKTSKSSSVGENITDSDSDTQSDSDSNSDWSETVKTQTTRYQLRNRIQKVSDQSECSTSTYAYRTRSESSYQTLQSLKLHSDDSSQSYASQHPVNEPNENDLTHSHKPELEFMEPFYDQPEAETLSEGDNRIINEWLKESEPLHVVPTHADYTVVKFLDFDDFMLNAELS